MKIGERVRVLRERLGFSRADFARQIGIDSSVIADIELGRTPLRFHVAVRLSARFWVNPRWLATGFLPVNFQINFYGQRYQLAPKSLFSRAYAEVLSVPVEKALAAQAAKANCRVEDLDSLFQRKVGSIAPDSPDAIAERNRRIVQWAGNILGLLRPTCMKNF
ncbi:MAG: helix-turn-helix transcriptional regulator [Chthoniobacter sp.]